MRLGVRALQEFFVETELVQDFQGRGVNSIAAEIAQEVDMLLEHQHAHAGARQQESRHHSCRSAAHDAACSLELVGRHGSLLLWGSCGNAETATSTANWESRAAVDKPMAARSPLTAEDIH